MTDQHRHDHNPEHDAQPYWVQYPDGTVAGPYYQMPDGNIVTLASPESPSHTLGVGAEATSSSGVQASASLAPAKITQPASVKAGAGAGATGSTPNVQATASLPKASTSTPNPTPVKSGPIKQA